MNNLQSSNLIIEIDDEIAVLIEEINATSGATQIDLAQSLKDVVIDSILGPFGLSETMFDDKDGGNITTAHNFEEALKEGKGHIIAPRDAERLQSLTDARNNPIDRNKVNGKHKAYDDKLNELLPSGSRPAGMKDAYTGKEMISPTRDHVKSVCEIERSAKGHLAQSFDERVETATMKENLVWTERGLNSSKGENDLLIWGTQEIGKLGPTYAQQAGVEWDRAKPIYDEAHKAINKKQNIAMLKKQSKEFLAEGGTEAGKLAFRQIIGMILKDLASGLIDDVKRILNEGFHSLKHLAEILRVRLLTTAETIKEKWADFLAEGGAAGFAGLLSNLVTLLINSFVTTVKRVVTIIREATLAIVRSVKMIVSPPDGMTGSEIAVAVLKLLSGGIVVAATLLLQESVAKAVESIPLFAPFAQDIATVLVAILGGTMGLLTVLAFDRLKENLLFQNKQLADVHRGHTVTFLKIKQTLEMFGQSYSHVTETTEQMQLRLTQDWMVIEESSSQANIAIAGYSSAIDRLRSMSKNVQ